MHRQNFEKLLLEAIDEALSSLGESPKRAIYYHLEKNFSVKKQEIPHKVEAFVDAIERIFGSGADFLEILIMKRFREKTGEVLELYEPTGFEFTEYMVVARRCLLEKDRAKKITEKMVQKCEEIGIEA